MIDVVTKMSFLYYWRLDWFSDGKWLYSKI